MEHTADEVKRLQGCIYDLISIQALPAIWSGQDSPHIIGTLLDVLVRVLRLDFVYARLSETVEGSPIEMVRLAQRRNPETQPQEVGRALKAWLTGEPPNVPFVTPNPIGEGNISIAPFRLGLQDETGLLLAASRRADFPTAMELMLLRVAANQAVVGLHEAQFLSDQRRAAEELERWVAKRTAQLTAVNEDLKKEITERKRIEEGLRESEERFRLMVEGVKDYAIFMLDTEGRVASWNAGAERIKGYRAEEILGRHFSRFYPAEEIAQGQPEEQLRLATATGRIEDAGWRVRKDGTRFWADVLITALRDEAGKLIGFSKVTRDVTERKRAEEDRRRSEAYLAEGQRISHTGSWAWNVSSGELFWSLENFRIFGLDPESVKVSYPMILQWIHPEDRSHVQQTFDEAVRERSDYELEYRVVRPDGMIKHIYSLAHPVFNESGDLTEYVGTVMDITERKRAEDELRTAQGELARVTRVTTMGELAASIAHEVNQPLAAVVTNANAGLRWLAAASPNLDEARGALGRIVRDGNRASDVIARIRALVRKTGIEKERLDMNKAIQEVVALAHGEVRRNWVGLRTELADDLPPVLGDRVELQQVVLNLVINGIEAMSSITERPRNLVITTRRDQSDKLYVSVEDSGIGLKPQNVERIFDAFYTTKREGMGMGLSISHSIIEAHKGRLWATQNDGPGATLHFTLPVHQA